MTTATPFPAAPLTISLGEMRAAMAAEAAEKKGLAGALVAVILSLLDALMALLAEFKSSRLAAHGALASAAPGRSATCAAPAAAESSPARANRRGDHEPSLPLAASSADRPENDGANPGCATGPTHAPGDAGSAAAAEVAVALGAGATVALAMPRPSPLRAPIPFKRQGEISRPRPSLPLKLSTAHGLPVRPSARFQKIRGRRREPRCDHFVAMS
jgi:hypothetical protein